jgi:hypothetical protein
MDFESLVIKHKALTKQIEELELQKKELGKTIMGLMQTKVVHLPNHIVKRIDRLSISMTVEDARKLEATKMQEAVDKDKIKTLFAQGVAMDGVYEFKYIQVLVLNK